MTLAVRNLVIQDRNGNLKAGASVEVRLDVQGKPLARIYSDRAGLNELPNPFETDDGKAAFFALGGAYQIKATLGDFEDIQNYVAIGRGAETDISLTNPRGTWSNAVSYAKGDLVTHTGTAGMRSFISLQDANLNHAPDADTPIVDTAWWMLSPGTTTEQAEAILSGATTQAGIATTQASVATTQANNALTQANNAAASAVSAAAASVSPSLRYGFDTGSTSGAGISSNYFRGNNATVASWTTMFFADSAVQGNVSAFLNSIFNGTSPTKGHIIGVNPLDETNFFIFAVTSVTDQSGRVDFAGSIVANSGAVGNNVAYVINFHKAGEPGFGDVLAANNLSDLANKKTANDNLHLIGTTVASAATVNLETATGDCVDISGTTTITAITLSEGHERTVRFQGALTLTHGSTLVLPNNGSNITTAAGDIALFRGYATGVVRCVSYTKLSGQPPQGNFITGALSIQEQGGEQLALRNLAGTIVGYWGTKGIFGAAGVDGMRFRSDGDAIWFGFFGFPTQVLYQHGGAAFMLAPADPGAGNFRIDGSYAAAVPQALSGTSGTVAVKSHSVVISASGTFTLTLPAAATYPGRMLYVKSDTPNAVNSASSNVVPLIGGSAGNAILTNTDGKWAILQSDGTNWIIMAAN